MANVSALVLIYDIRGFTAASKRMGTANLGAFATAAHKAILDEFAPCPPTFVKNLGDGHLLLWETGATPDPELVSKVVEGAARARTSFTAFVAGQGALGESLPKKVGIGVALGEVSRSDDYYGVALNLAARLQNMARPEGLAVDRPVFETVAARNADWKKEFQKARVHLKGLGSTLVWVDRPFSWARVLGKVARVALVLAVPLAYLALSDAGLALPGSVTVRRALDRHGLSLLRPVPTDAAVRRAADDMRRSLTAAILRARTPGGWIHSDLRGAGSEKGEDDNPKTEDLDTWSSSQAICALTKAPHLSNADLAPYLVGLRATFDPSRYIEARGKAYGWVSHPGIEHTEVEPALWTVAAVASALAREGLVPSAERPAFLELLRKAQDATKPHYLLEDGGWNTFPDQVHPALHSPYSTTLALLALLETREAGLPWAGSDARRDELLKATLRHIHETWQKDAALPGWRRTHEVLDGVSPGLTLQTYALLERASAQGLYEMQPAMRAAIGRHLAQLAGSSMDQPPDAGEFGLKFTDHKGVEVQRSESINFLWHPWAIDAAHRWLHATEHGGAPVEDRTEAIRVLGHLTSTLGPEAVRGATAAWTFIASETLYGLSSIPPP